MGFISNVAGTLSDSISSEIKDQYLEAFRTDSLGQDMSVLRIAAAFTGAFGSVPFLLCGYQVLLFLINSRG